MGRLKRWANENQAAACSENMRECERGQESVRMASCRKVCSSDMWASLFPGYSQAEGQHLVGNVGLVESVWQWRIKSPSEVAAFLVPLDQNVLSIVTEVMQTGPYPHANSALLHHLVGNRLICSSILPLL